MNYKELWETLQHYLIHLHQERVSIVDPLVVRLLMDEMESGLRDIDELKQRLSDSVKDQL